MTALANFGTLCLLWATVAWAAQPPQLYSGLLGSSQLLSLAQGAPERAFQIWAQHHKKEYADEQTHKSRFAVWQANVEFIRQHQASGSSMQLALNEFADLSWEEFSQGRLGLLGEQALKQRALRDARNKAPFRYASTQAPNSMDWRDKGAVTDVKNQGQCGSCWSFSTTGAIEGVNAIATGELVALSEEQLVDCDTEKNMGCGGGLMDWAYEYVVKNGGLDTEVDFPYWSGWGMTLWRCNRRKEHDRTVVTIDGFEDVPADEASLLKAAANQPISVGICASSAMQFYSGGIIDKCCDGLNHGVLVVGYGEDERDGTPYWLVKNSWGGAWGAEGYFKLKRNVAAKGGLCGIATAASYPVKTSPNHPVPQMCDMFGWTECGATATCSCSYKLFGWWCVWHDCCPLEQASTCDDGQHCCPNNAPICDTRNGVCTNADGTISVPWTAKEKANTFAERMPQRAQEFARFAGKAEPYPERPLPPQ